MANIIDIIVNAQDRASQIINQVGSEFDSLSGRAQKASGLITAGLGAMGVGLGAVAVAGIKYNAMLESSDARWQTLTGSVEGANKQMDFIADYAKSSPFDYQGIDETATSLMGMGMELKDVNKWIPTLGDMASVMGGGTETIKGVGVALGQMSAKGKVSAEEMGQLAERGVNGWQMIADAMGLSVGEVRKLSEDGKLLAKDALPMIQAGMAETFGGGTATYMKSAKGQFDQIQEGAMQLAGTLTAGAYEYFGTTVLPMVNNALGTLQGHFDGGLLAGFQSLWDGSTQAKVGLTALAVVITSLLIGALFLIAPAVASAVVAFAPFIAIGMAVVGLVALITANWGTIKPFFMNIFNTIKPLFEGFKQSALTAFQTLLAGVQPIWAQFKTLLVSLQPVFAVIGAVLMVFLTVAMAVFNGVVSAIAPVITAFLALVDFVVNVVMTIVNLLTGNWAGAMASWNRATQSAVTFFKSIWQAIVGFFTGFVGTFISILGSFGINVVAGFNKMWNSAKQAVNNGIKAVLVFLATLASQGLSKVTSMGTSIVSAFTSFMAKSASTVSKGISNVIKFFTNMRTTATSIIKAVGSAIVSGFTNAMSRASSAVSSGISKVISFFTKMGSTVRSTVTSIANTLVSSFTSMMSRGASAVSSGVSRIISTIKGFASTFLSAGRGLLEAFTKGIKAGIDKAVSAVSSGMSKIRDFLPFSPSKKGALRDLDKSGESFFPTWTNGAMKGVPAMVKSVSTAMAQVAPQNQANKLFQFQGKTPLAKYFNAIIEDGDHLNDWATHLPKEIRSQLLALGKEFAQFEGMQAFTGGKTTVTVKHVHSHNGTVKVQGDANSQTVDFAKDSIKAQTEQQFLADLRLESRRY